MRGLCADNGLRQWWTWGDGERGSNRVNRGGSWNNNPANVRSANRNNNDPGNRNNNIGFRLASTNRIARQGRSTGRPSAHKVCPTRHPVPVPCAGRRKTVPGVW
ncbi:MAG: SUMF1/EgtB/PvdO family nonheme iron enzyme [Magnetococcales bacterium]|nr:SUMF1/EgtB/PvdO family nonheme iron enzyme [Magnetococcales bacterium]